MSTQALFAQALQLPGRRCPPLFNGEAAASRFAVYRNNVAVSLSQSLADSYPVVQQLVGDDFFAAMARQFVLEHPPQSPLMVNYGEHFANFIERFEPAASLPYLADVARLERLRVCAFHAADSPAIDPQRLAIVLDQPDLLAGLQFTLHPSLAVLDSRYAVCALWAAHHGADISQVNPDIAQTALVLRHGLQVEVINLPPGAGAFMSSLLHGRSFGLAASQGTARDPQFELVPILTLLIGKGAIIHLTPPQKA